MQYNPYMNPQQQQGQLLGRPQAPIHPHQLTNPPMQVQKEGKDAPSSQQSFPTQTGIPQGPPQMTNKEGLPQQMPPEGVGAPYPMMTYDPRAYGIAFFPQQQMQQQMGQQQQQQQQQGQAHKGNENTMQPQFPQAFYYPQYPYGQYSPMMPQYQPQMPQMQVQPQQQENQSPIKDEKEEKVPQEESKQGSFDMESRSVSKEIKQDTLEVSDSKSESQAILRKVKMTQPKWTKQDNDRLLKLAKNTKGQWKKIARIFNRPMITPLYVKNKYLELNPGRQQELKKWVKYTRLEDLMIAKYSKLYNNDWNRVALHFSHRDGMMLKNRFYAYTHRDENQGLLDEALSLEEKYRCILDDMMCDDSGTKVIGPKPKEDSSSSESGSLTVSYPDRSDSSQEKRISQRQNNGNSSNSNSDSGYLKSNNNAIMANEKDRVTKEDLNELKDWITLKFDTLENMILQLNNKNQKADNNLMNKNNIEQKFEQNPEEQKQEQKFSCENKPKTQIE